MNKPVIDCAGKPLDLSRPRIMGVLNITPDSFSDGGKFLAADMAVIHSPPTVDEGGALITNGRQLTPPPCLRVVF